MGAYGNVIIPDTMDRGAQPLWDRAIILAAGAAVATSYQFFSVPIGQASKTKVDTNLTGKGSSLSYTYHVQSIGFMVKSNVLLADLQTFLETSYFEFKIGPNIYMEGPLHVFPAGAGIDAMTTRTNEASINIGRPDPNAARRFPEMPRTIPAGFEFSVIVYVTSGFTLSAATTSPAGTGLQVACILDGIKDKASQL